MKSALLLLLLLYCCTACKPGVKNSNRRTSKAIQHQVVEGPTPGLTYYDYGGPPELYFYKAQVEVLAKYGVNYKGFGCVITDSIVQAIAKHNDSLFDCLRTKFPGLDKDSMLREIQNYAATQKR